MTSASKDRSWTSTIGPNGETRHISSDVARRVWLAAGGRCTICKKNLVFDEVTGQDVLIGQLAHIVGWSQADGSPRGKNSSLPASQRNTADNLMLLCHDQHKVIDTRTLWEVYDEETLRRLKRRHEDSIRQLTGLTDANKSTVLRVVGGIGEVPVELSRNATARYLLERDRFPDYALLGVEEEFEIDLRSSAGQDEGTRMYWDWAKAQIKEARERLRSHVEKGKIERLSVLGLARIPLLVAVGAALGEGIPVELYPTRRTGAEGFGWTPDVPTATFDWSIARNGDDNIPPAVILAISGPVDIGELHAHVPVEAHVYELQPNSGSPNTEVICNQESIDNFARCWRRLLSELERRHPRDQGIAVFPAVPAVAAITMGRLLIRGAHPPLRLFDRNRLTREFVFAMQIER